jgi:hypothetical protein
MKTKSIVIAFLIILVPSLVFAEEGIKTGFDLYQHLKLMENTNTQNIKDIGKGMHALGYLKGCYEGILLMERAMAKIMKNKNIIFLRLNIPEKSIKYGQLLLIYKKYAEQHPGKLHEIPPICIHKSLVEAYGYKQ